MDWRSGFEVDSRLAKEAIIALSSFVTGASSRVPCGKVPDSIEAKIEGGRHGVNNEVVAIVSLTAEN